MDLQEIAEALARGVDAQTLPVAAADGKPTLRERWRRAMFHQRVDRIPNFEFGYWEETLDEWRKQGLPPHVKDEASAYRYFGIENWHTAPVHTAGLNPGFEHRTLSEDDRYIVYRAANGCTARINKVGHKSIPHYLDFLLKDRRSWEEDFKPRLDIARAAERLPANWPELVGAYARRDYPLAINRGSLIGVVRDWIGFEGIALMVHDDPELLEEIVEHIGRLACGVLELACRDVEFDFAGGWEDICFNSGPIVGVDFMNNVVSPRYRRISDILEKHGCFVSWTDCDGNILSVLDAFWKGGINCCFPIEVHGGSDPLLIRKKYPDMRLQGGFCKMRFLENREAVRKEIERLKPLVREGGFLPGVDHRVQADAKLDLYKYYLKLKRDIYGCGGEPEYDESQI